MNRGFVDLKIAVVILVTAIVSFVVLDSVVVSATQNSQFTDLKNLTGFFYTGLNNPPASQVKVFNDTACAANELVNGVDFVVDNQFNGVISGASVVPAPKGNGLQFDQGDVVSMTTSGELAFIGNHTILGWVRPTGL